MVLDGQILLQQASYPWRLPKKMTKLLYCSTEINFSQIYLGQIPVNMSSMIKLNLTYQMDNLKRCLADFLSQNGELK
jgi:hypothetical protein